MVLIHVHGVTHLIRTNLRVQASIVHQSGMSSAHHLEVRPLESRRFQTRQEIPFPTVVVSYRDHLALDDYYVRVLTLKEPPAQTFPNLLAALQELPSNFIAVTEWSREDNFAMRKAINSQSRRHHNSKASMMTYASWRDQPTRPDEVLIDDAEVARSRWRFQGSPVE